MTGFSNRNDARAHCRAARAALSPADRRAGSERLVRRFRSSLFYPRAQRIAMFWPLRDEVDLRALIHAAVDDRKQVYLPVMRPNHQMLFARFRAESELQQVAFGIMEPALRGAELIAPQYLDTVCVPLLGFDRLGNRLGMGGGYYDRCFGFRNGDPGGSPRLIGTAFSCQELGQVPVDEWDVRLDAVITDAEQIDCVQRRNSR